MATIQAKSVRRREDLRLLTGQGNYAADAARPKIAVAIFLRSPYAHARIERDRPDPRANIAGVIAVYTAADLTDVAPIPGGIGFPRPDGGPAPKTDRPLLAADRVRFVGEPVALVIAETRAAGLEAAEAIAVDYAAMPVVTEPVAALAVGRTHGLGRRARQYRLPVASAATRTAPTPPWPDRRTSRPSTSPSPASPPTRWSRAAPGPASPTTGGSSCTPPTSRPSRCATAWRAAIFRSRPPISAWCRATSADPSG